jgi:glycosyltransferase involved in cell wall biosynthesis
MRVLYIITQGEQGGGQKNVFDLAVGMKQKGHEVFVAVGEIENEGDKWLHAELEKNGIPKSNLLELKKLQREVKPFRDIKSLFEVIKLLKNIKPDIVHLHSSKAGVVGALACFLSRVKSVYTVHGFVFLEPMNIIKKIIYISLEFCSSLFRKFTILISEKDISVGKKLFILRGTPPFQGGARGGYKLIYNGVSEKSKENMLSRDEAREFLFGKIQPHLTSPINRGGTIKIVGTISNLYKTKGLEYLIDAASDMTKAGQSSQNTLFFVLGFGSEKYQQELQNKINSLGLQNNFFLFGKTPAAYKYLKAFDLFTLTSVKEGLPYTLLEAKMAGVPILATSVGGIPEMAKNFPINLVESKNVLEIKNKIVEILEDKEGKFKVNNKLPEVYSLQNMLDETEKVYNIIHEK